MPTLHPSPLPIEESLGEECYRLTTAVEPPNAAEVTALAPDLVVLDVVINGNRLGMELLVALKSDPATARIPVLVCTADARFLAERSSLPAEWDCATVSKPFDIDAFLATVARCPARPVGVGLDLHLAAPTAPVRRVPHAASGDSRLGMRGRSVANGPPRSHRESISDGDAAGTPSTGGSGGRGGGGRPPLRRPTVPKPSPGGWRGSGLPWRRPNPTVAPTR